MEKKVALILAGCGNLDGSEIHESVLSFLALKENGLSYQCFAPDLEFSAISYLSKKKIYQKRNALEEAARIARSDILSLEKLNPQEFDVLWFPGGGGAASILSTFQEGKEEYHVLDGVKKAVEAFYKSHKPIVALCIAPVILASVLKGKKVKLTLGSDSHYQNLLDKMGHRGVLCQSDEFCFDEEHKIFTTPAYMEKPNLPGIHKALTMIVLNIKKL